MPWIPIALAAVQIGAGIIKGAKAKREANKLLAERQPYKTPTEIMDIVNATKANASTGFSAQTLDYINNQSAQNFSTSLGVASRLGADPNVMSDLFHRNVNSLISVYTDNQAANMQNFGMFLNSLNAAASNNAAEQKSQQDILKDRLQQVANEKAIASQQVSEGLNTGISAYSAWQTGQLYGDDKMLNQFNNAYGDQGASAYNYARANGLNFSQYDKQFRKNSSNLFSAIKPY